MTTPTIVQMIDESEKQAAVARKLRDMIRPDRSGTAGKYRENHARQANTHAATALLLRSIQQPSDDVLERMVRAFIVTGNANLPDGAKVEDVEYHMARMDVLGPAMRAVLYAITGEKS